MVPVFVVAALPILWRRRGILAAIGISFVVVAASVPAFGWVVRCGFALPLSIAMAYAVARLAGSRQNHLIGLVGILALQVVTLVKDSATGGLSALAISVPAAAIHYGTGLLVQTRADKRTARPVLGADATTGFEPFVLAFPIVLIVFGIGRAVRHRTAMSAELTARTIELRELRDERVALEVAGDRARLSHQLDGLLQERLGQLTTAAESGAQLDPVRAGALFGSIENDSRETLTACARSSGSCAEGTSLSLRHPPLRTWTTCWRGIPGRRRG